MGSSQGFCICLVLFLTQLSQAMSDVQCDSLTEFPMLNRCCHMCPPGEYVGTECTTNTDSICKPCSPGFYQSTWNNQNECRRHSVCTGSGGFITKVLGTRINNTVCQCKPGKHCPNKDCEVCENNKVCQIGYGVVFEKQDGGEFSLPMCKECQLGYFSNESSATEPCRKWNDCGMLEVQKKGTSSRDVECASRERDDRALMNLVTVLSVVLIIIMLSLAFYFGRKKDNRTKVRNAIASALKCKDKIQKHPKPEQETTDNGRIITTAEDEDRSPETLTQLITV